ncbi:hypothetical protein C9I99_11030 [Photobacterium lutimaris]|uniref:Uncharacterized protein n=1 Tax=Photobacterium lutimaris TaxID=388278 RepID=A0A2T3IZ09_9GAMM|nr:hypothetical protein C9I99_11030 [Photobacterium lutimaris]TDR76221.1 hypothetical protein DFP78_103217 [Photobacterium lutimaris]
MLFDNLTKTPHLKETGLLSDLSQAGTGIPSSPKSLSCPHYRIVLACSRSQLKIKKPIELIVL